jgi:head-tail adaptor
MSPETRTDPVSFAPVLDPGDLWHVGTIVSRVLVDLPNGGQEIQDVDLVLDEPMSVSPLTARERAEQGGIASEATHRVRLYWVAGVRPTQSLKVHDPLENRDRVFEIVAVLNVEERGWLLDLTVVEKAS